MFLINGKQLVFCAGEMGLLISKAFQKKFQLMQTGEPLGFPLLPQLYGIKFRVSAESRVLGKISDK